MEKDKAVKRLLLRYIKKYIPYAMIAVIGIIVFSLCEIVKADLLKDIVDAAKDKQVSRILMLFLYGAAAILVTCLSVYANHFFSGKFATLILRDIKRDSAEHIADIPADYMSSNRTGEILSKMSADADVVQSFMESGFISLIQIPFTIIFFSVYLIRLNAWLFLLCFAPVPILAVIGASFATPFKKGSKEYMQYLGRVNNTVHDMVSGISLVKSYNLEAVLLKKYRRDIHRATDMAIHNDRYQYKGSFVFALIRNITTLICLVAGSHMCLMGHMTVGVLVSFITLLSKMVSPFISASSILFQAKQAAAAAERLLSVLMTEKEPSGSYCGNSDNAGSAIVAFENVVFEYENGTRVLKGLSFTAERGKTTAFAGASGCGKSTVFNLICGFYHNQGGCVRFMGKNENEWNMVKLRKNISYVSQFSFLFPVSIYENIAMGKRGATREEIISAAKQANAHEFIIEMPDGYDTIVGERGCRLSGGQVQRIAIARAILKDAPVLLLDEATSALDIKSEYLVQQAINNLSRKKTVLVIAHRLSTIRAADKIIIIDQGKNAEEGTHEELLKANGIYARLYDAGKEEEAPNEETE